ncbi:MAG: ribonuclease PH [Syntrophales bacterium]|jgi:ribonuclease PH
MRDNGRAWDEMRPLRISRDFIEFAEGSVMIEMGRTRVICTASIEDKVPAFLKNTGRGWLTAEYSMLPMSSQVRIPRESARGRVGGRTHEIQRLIGRSLRAVTDLKAFGERTIYIDCDVIQADGGTRTASITGGFVALVDLFRRLRERGMIQKLPIEDSVSAISIGMVNGEVLLDLEYEEDLKAEVDMNFVMTGGGLFIEVQGTAEAAPFDRSVLDRMTDVAVKGIAKLTEAQIEILGGLS